MSLKISGTYLKHGGLYDVIGEHVAAKFETWKIAQNVYVRATYRTKSISVSGVKTLEALSTDSMRVSTILAPCPGRMVVTKQMPKTTAEIVVTK